LLHPPGHSCIYRELKHILLLCAMFCGIIWSYEAPIQGGRKLKALRIARAEAGLNIGELARRSGVGRDTISRVEHGKTDPQGPTLHKLATALGTTVEDLYAMEERLAPLEGAEPRRLAWVLDMRLGHWLGSLEAHNRDRQRELASSVALVPREDLGLPPEELSITEGPARRAWVAGVLSAKRRITRELEELGVSERVAELLAVGVGGAAADPDVRRAYEEAVQLNAALVELWAFLPEEEEKLAEAAHASVETEYRRLAFGATIQGSASA
jgi:transcriptional regulator with XRE-family HTH domain